MKLSELEPNRLYHVYLRWIHGEGYELKFTDLPDSDNTVLIPGDEGEEVDA